MLSTVKPIVYRCRWIFLLCLFFSSLSAEIVEEFVLKIPLLLPVMLLL